MFPADEIVKGLESTAGALALSVGVVVILAFGCGGLIGYFSH